MTPSVITKQIPTEIYSRVCGYYRPVNQFHVGKREEFADRVTVKVTADTVKPEC